VGLIAILCLCLCTFAARELGHSAEVRGFHSIDAARVALDAPGGTTGCPPEWSSLVAARLCALGKLTTLDGGAQDELRAVLGDLACVSEVGEVRVIWPDGLQVEVRLREPVACVQSGSDYIPVAADGTLLPGYWSAPPDFGLGLLPVLGPGDGAFDLALAGDVLQEARHQNALSVAVSMREHLSREEIGRVGRLLIDAGSAHLASVSEAGTRLKLEQRRLVLWGRVPRSMAPGELPEAQKWAHVMAALGYLEGPEATDWDLVDVRWDTATLRPR